MKKPQRKKEPKQEEAPSELREFGEHYEVLISTDGDG